MCLFVCAPSPARGGCLLLPRHESVWEAKGGKGEGSKEKVNDIRKREREREKN